MHFMSGGIARKRDSCYNAGIIYSREAAMRITLNQIKEGEDEIVLNYRKMTPELERIVSLLRSEKKRLIGWQEKRQVVLEPGKLFYIESVDNRCFGYTKEEVYRLEFTLSELAELLEERGFFRCSKSMVINIYRVESLKSLPCNRIDARMENGEHIVISRTYASEFRKRLRGGVGNEA